MANLKIKHAILTLRENFNCMLWQILSLQYRTSTWSYICNFVYISHEKKHALKWRRYCKLLVTTLVVSEVHQWMLPKSASRFSLLVSSNLKDLCIKIEFTWNKNQHLFLLCNIADSDFSFPFMVKIQQWTYIPSLQFVSDIEASCIDELVSSAAWSSTVLFKLLYTCIVLLNSCKQT